MVPLGSIIVPIWADAVYLDYYLKEVIGLFPEGVPVVYVRDKGVDTAPIGIAELKDYRLVDAGDNTTSREPDYGELVAALERHILGEILNRHHP